MQTYSVHFWDDVSSRAICGRVHPAPTTTTDPTGVTCKGCLESLLTIDPKKVIAALHTHLKKVEKENRKLRRRIKELEIQSLESLDRVIELRAVNDRLRAGVESTK